MSEQFMQECQVCGRPLRIMFHFSGQSVACQHCGGCFVARDPAGAGAAVPSSADSLLHRADELLEMAASVLTMRRHDIPVLAGHAVTRPHFIHHAPSEHLVAQL